MSVPSLRPNWLRPTVLAAVLTAHGGAILFTPSADVTPGNGPVEITLVSSVEEPVMPTPEILPSDASRAEAPPPKPEEPVVEETPTPPPIAVPDPKPEVAREKPKKERIEKRREKKPERKPEPTETARLSAVDASARAASRAAEAEERRASAASYASLVAAEIARHKHYPSAAREAGITGVVVVAFTIGPGGTVSSHTIVRSSGAAILDSAVHSMMAAVGLPPPPGGSYRSSISVRFDLR